MVSLLLLALLYLFTTLALVFAIDRFVGVMFPSSADKSPVPVQPQLPDSSS